MPLLPGHALGPYEVIAPLGAGGMGEVYSARDTRLDRTVAIKVLPAALAADPEFKARFEREAKSISALNHPHICTLFDVGTSGDASYLVLEHLEGETLADRLKAGPLPVEQALEIASQIADALDKAHRQGIVHRDLKPANVFLLRAAGPSGLPRCKLLDFGLAKMGTAAAPGSIETRLMSSPATVLGNESTPLTAQGSLLGTFQYMSPEQIEGQETDARSDIWAFGCVLYEMLTGRRAFEGKSQASLIASILERQPVAVAELQPMTPPALSRIVRTCLEKDPDNRYHTAHDLRLHLQWIAEGGSAAGLPAPVIVERRRHSALVFAAGALAFAVFGAAGAWALKPAPAATNIVGRFSYQLPDGVLFTRGGRQNVAIAPDGSQIAFIAANQIFLRRIGDLEAQRIRGTDVDPVDLAFSPDGKSLVFFVPTVAGGTLNEGHLKTVAVTGGPLVSLCPAAEPYGVRWQGRRIVFGQSGKRILAVPDTGGTPETLLDIGEEPGLISQPQLVNGDADLIYTFKPPQSLWSGAQVVTEKAGGGQRRVLVPTGTDGRLLSTGHLVYVANDTLFAQKMTSSLAATGGPVPMVEGVQFSVNTTGVGRYAISDNGTLSFVPGSSEGRNELVWVDRKGNVENIGARMQPYTYPRLSPDGKRIAVSNGGVSGDIFIWDIERKLLSPLTQGPEDDDFVEWTADSRHVIYRSSRAGSAADLFKRAADGTGSVEQLTQTPDDELPYAVLPDGRVVLNVTAPGRIDLLMHLFTPGGGKPVPLAAGPNRRDYLGTVSPDGRWIAYVSDENGAQNEVHVRPFPNTGAGHWQISSGGGNKPAWSRSGRELFFTARNPTRLFSVPVQASTGPTFSYGAPAALLDVSTYRFNQVGRPYDLSLDDQRFLMVSRPGQTAEDQTIIIVTHWIDELKAKTSIR